MEKSKRYMVGNLVLINNKVHKIIIITDTEVTAKNVESGYLSVHPYSDIKDIPLDDEFFRVNEYHISEPHTEGDKLVYHIIANDYFGPAITKYEPKFPNIRDEVEYCITGIIIRTVDEFQNLMNICHCQNIADKIIAG